jgi:hypothetical protein
VAHRLRLAGATQAVFAPDALEALFRWSGGVPRVLNTLADNALFEAFLSESKPVDSSIVATAAESLGLTPSAIDDPYPSMPSLQTLAPAKSAAAPAADWLEPVAPMPADTSDLSLPPASRAFAEVETELAFGDDSQGDMAGRETFVEAITAPPFEEDEPLGESLAEPIAEAADLELEEVIAEESSPELPAFEAEEELGAEPEAAPEDSDWSLGSLLSEEEPPEDLAAIVPSPKRAAPAPARTVEQQRNEDSFDLRSLVDEVEAEPAPAKDEDNLDALFDEIQVED